MSAISLKEVATQLHRVQCRDQSRLRKLYARTCRDENPELMLELQKKVAASLHLTNNFAVLTTEFAYPAELPISARTDEIKRAISQHQVLILAGDTGSGKTTQLPKICMEAGLGCRGLIAHTQPRRLAARTVASRIAEEIGCELGERVGYQIRFKDLSGEHTQLKLMTDGVLLAEFQRDPWLSRYEVIIIDEAHERSLNIDFILGLLKPLLKKRSDLKLIITSATIDLNSFAQYFKRDDQVPPVIEVSGRTYPVEIHYLSEDPPAANATANLETQIASTVAMIVQDEARGHFKTSGDILVFCAGEREIRAAARAVRELNLALDVLPLYARLSVTEQNKVFRPSQYRKVVLATNVAETSITVPGIAYVIDPGLARVSQYNFRAKVQKLPIAEISQASANQRMGRCGRVRNGVCFRLYSQKNFAAREAFTPAEILRSNLTSVVLQMLRLGIKDPKRFDFLDKPDPRLLNDGLKQLQELDAIDKVKNLTPTGRLMSDLPVDPQLARMLVEARQSTYFLDAIIVAAAQSMREVQEHHANASNRLAPQHPQSDFCGQLLLWQTIEAHRQALSNKEFRALCEQQSWSIQRVFEWRDLVRQLKTLCATMAEKPLAWHSLSLDKQVSEFKQQLELNSERYGALHRAVVAGFIGNILNYSIEGDYIGTRSRSIAINKDSTLKKSKAKWLVASELTETNRVYARTVAVIRPDWILIYAKNALKYSYSDPHFDAQRGEVTALRKTLYKGLVLKLGEHCSYQRVDLAEARTLFIQAALVAGEYKPTRRDIKFVHHNQQLLTQIEKYEVKTRRRSLLRSDSWLFDFYAQQIPQDCANVASLEKWIAAQTDAPLHLSREQFIAPAEQKIIAAQFPDTLSVQGRELTLSYSFAPNDDADGVTLHVPVALLAPLPLHLGDWLVPGLLAEKCAALIKTLPKPIRQAYTPANAAVAQVLDKLTPENLPLTNALGAALQRARGTKIPHHAWNPAKLATHLCLHYCIEDVDGSLIETGSDLVHLKRTYATAVSTNLQSASAPERRQFEQIDVSTWPTELSLDAVQYRHQGMTVVVYPMHQLQEDGSINLVLSESACVARFHNRRSLAMLVLKELSITQSRTVSRLFKEVGQRLRGETEANKRPHRETPPVSTVQATASASSMAAQLKALKLATGTGGSTARSRPSKGGKLNARAQNTNLNQESRIQLAICMAIRANTQNCAEPVSHAEFSQITRLTSESLSSTALAIATQLHTIDQLQVQLLSALNHAKADTIAVDQAIEDMKAQLYRLCDPVRIALSLPSDLQQYPRLFKAIEHRLARIEEQAFTTGEAISTLQEWQTRHATAVTSLCAPLSALGLLKEAEQLPFAYLTLPAMADFAWMLEEWRVSLFAQQLKTRYSISEQRIQRAWQALKTAITAQLEQI